MIKATTTFVLIVTFLIAGYSFSQTPQTQQQSSSRDLTLYDKAGPFEITIDDMVRGQAQPVEGKIREWLWSHWMSRRRGCLSVTRYSKEGEPSTSSYFVEPDSRGRWKIAVTISRVLTDRRHPSGKAEQRSEYEAYSVERVEPQRNKTGEFVSIPKNVTRAGQTYLLLLGNLSARNPEII